MTVLDPLHTSTFHYDVIRWEKLIPEAKKSVASFAGKYITRQDVIQAYQAYYKGKADFIYPFTLSMIWGFSTNGYGTYRTNKYLETVENRDKIKRALDLVKDNKIETAYKTLKEIKGLNISYISKVLYFATRALEIKNYALIFDIRVASALVKLLNPEVAAFLEVTPSNKFKDYQKYNEMLHHWATELKVEAEALEMFLFEFEEKWANTEFININP